MLHGEAEEKKIPPIAHFIWAGGKALLPVDGIEIVSGWIRSCCHIDEFKAFLWIDKKTTSARVIADYKQLFQSKGISVLDETETSSSQVSAPQLFIMDIETHGLRNEFVSYEIEKLRPNYGSSSDLLRYEILHTYGGFYCDCTDVSSGITPLVTIFEEKFQRDVLYLDHCPQQPYAPAEKLQNFGVNELGNDTFAVTKNNQVMSIILNKARQQYDLLSEKLELSHIIVAHSGNNTKDITIARTGPGLVRAVLLGDMTCTNQDTGVLISADKKLEIRRVRDGAITLTQPKSNTGSWLNMRITRHENPEDAIKAVIETIKFEATHFKILRLDDHVKDLLESTNNQLTPKQILDRLQPVIEHVLEKIKYTQLTGEFPETIGCALKNTLTSIFNLSLQPCIQAFNAQAMLNDLIRVEKIAKQQKERLSEQARLKSMSIESLILDSQRPEVKNNLCIQITQGLTFMSHLIQHLDKFDPAIKIQIQNHLIERFKKYEEYAPLLSGCVEEKYKVDPTLMTRLGVELGLRESHESEPPSLVVPKK